MKTMTSLLFVLLLTASLSADSATAQETKGIISKLRLEGSNYCHLRFPAIRRDTLYTNRPVLKDPASGDIIDFYGPCDHDPLGKEQIRAQREDRSRVRRREWGDN